MVCAAVAVFGLILVAKIKEQPRVPDLPKKVITKVDYKALVLNEVEALFSALNADVTTIQRDMSGTPAKYTVTANFPSDDLLETFASRLKKIPGHYSLLKNNKALLVDKGGQTQVVVTFVLPPPDIPSGPLMSIIMDDLGRSTHVAETLNALSEPITFSILPGEARAVQVAEIAFAAGREVMLHVPMEPQGYPAVNPGSDALFVKYPNDEIRNRLNVFLSRIPHVTGANNHMGSRFTEDARALAPVMKSLQEKGLFFVDSRTTGNSRVSVTAEKFGVPTLSRDVFLDNVADVEAIVKEIRHLESQARRKGQAIGICHPYPETLEALKRELPKMRERGVTVVPISILLQKQVMAQKS